MIGIFHYLALSVILFCIGLYGVLTRRNGIAVLMSIELMFNAANINFAAFSYYFKGASFVSGQTFPLFVIAVAASEAAVGLAIVLSLYRNRKTVNVDEANQLRG
ncbi:MAG: NADH-quinone oxidoreductase subunit NuoK [Firmicutes bacterium]|nr:NADH-quinone oxidoreductase subunit NuoK [Bacillota bacterium]